MTAKLFDVEEGVPVLLGGRCGWCGYTFFPMQLYGCERCGSLDLLEHRMAGRGRLASFATVFVHRDPALPPPFTIGSVELDGGVTLRAIVEAPIGSLHGGEVLEAVVVDQPRAAVGDMDLHFRTVA